MRNKYIDKVQKFMYGRYGVDDLYNFLLKLYIIVLVVDIFVNCDVLVYLELFIVITMFYRFFSKKINKRREENRSFLKIKNAITNPFSNWFKYVKDKNNIYKRCRKCGTILKLPLPLEYGIKHVKCPKCKKRLNVLCLKKEKVEVIKKKRSREVNKSV